MEKPNILEFPFYNEETEQLLDELEKNIQLRKSERRFQISYERLIYAYKRAKQTFGVNLKQKDIRDYFSQEMGKALIPDRHMDIF